METFSKIQMMFMYMGLLEVPKNINQIKATVWIIFGFLVFIFMFLGTLTLVVFILRRDVIFGGILLFSNVYISQMINVFYFRQIICGISCTIANRWYAHDAPNGRTAFWST